MPAVLVHGVPDTHHLWDEVRKHLSRQDVITPDLPGFGVDAPPGFVSTKEEYVDWLTTELEKIGEPVDLVGHDWGSLIVSRLVSIRPDLIRTWAAGGGAIDEGYSWHPIAQMWQTPGMGEQVMDQFTVEATTTALAGDGMPENVAREIAERVDDRMKAAILSLYRSAVNIGKEWGPELRDPGRPGLLIWGESDQYMALEYAKRMAGRMGAGLVTFPGGHWWPVQFPKDTAEALEHLWESAP